MIRLPALLLLSVASAAGAAPPGEGFDVEHYEVSLRPDLATGRVSGTETIRVRSTSDGLARLSFSPNALRIVSATVDGRPVSLASDKEAIAFVLPGPLAKGRTATLRFRMEGTPARGVTRTPGGLYTGYFACDWMVCLQDSPGDKAHLTLDLFLPSGASSLGPGRAKPTKAGEGGLVRHRWRSTRPYSAYLYAFAAGPFARDSARSGAGELIYLNGTGEPARLGALFAQAPAMADFFAEKAGLPLPDGRYAQLLVPGSEAQETAGFSLIGKEEMDSERDQPDEAWIVAHEMAHAWWGNFVTCASWQHFWLNEGIATFMVAAWKQHHLGEAAYRQELANARARVERVRELGFDKPLTWSGRYPSLGARRAIQYSKGALFLAELRASIGETAFWGGLRLFTRRHAGKTVVSRDFQQAMEEASGRDLSSIFNQWVYDEKAMPAPPPPGR